MKSSIGVLVSVLAVTSAAMISCGKTVTIPGGTSTTSALQPVGEHSRAAKGEVKVKGEDNGNTRLSVNVEHLASPETVASNATTYVVWAKPSQGEGRAQNLGALVIDADRKGSLDTVTPLKNFEVIVTPEPSASATSPSHTPVFTGIVER
jgi:hypothetical protein